MRPKFLIAGRYEVLGEIEGGVELVYKVQDALTKRTLALRTVPVGTIANKDWVRLAALKHPNIVDICDFGEFEIEGRHEQFIAIRQGTH
jgi:hypothetical protein